MSRLLGSPASVVKKAATSVTLNQCLWLAIAVGIFLRLAQYLLNRSLWIDEAFLALNILNHSFLELLQPLDYNQGAPVGFLWVEKLAVQLLGNSEYVLRLFPFLCGILALLLFHQIAKWFLSLPAALIAVSLFALSDRLIYYSAELKQYSSDVAIALLLYLMSMRLQAPKLTFLEVAIAGLIGAVLIWFSHPAIFVLTGIGLTLLGYSFIKNERSKIYQYFLLVITWSSSFSLFYINSIRELSNNSALQKSWDSGHNAFAPLIPLTISDFRWLFDKFFEVLNYPVGLYLTGIAAMALLMGCVSMLNSKKKKFLLLISPILIALLASGLHKYPFKGQLILFIVPLVLLLIAEGTQQILETTHLKSSFIGLTFIALLFFHPLYYAASNLYKPQAPPHFEYQRVREEIKPVLGYIQKNWQPGDVLYLYYASQYAFKYYAERYGFNFESLGKPSWSTPPKDWFAPALPSYPPQLIVGEYARNDWRIFERELNKIRGNQRVWILFSHVSDRRSFLDEEDMFLYLLNRAGTQQDSFKSMEASAYLYDLSESQ